MRACAVLLLLILASLASCGAWIVVEIEAENKATMKNVRAKFRCSSVTKTTTGSNDEAGNPIYNEGVKMQAVYGPDGSPNGEWSRWTPSGSLELNVTNPALAGHFLPGKEYFIDIVEAPRSDT